MALTIDESWVRERVKLKHDHLDDVKALSLPGTYHEKIASLGTALRSFSRLKNLDLSRNAIQSLEGVESLHLLETLNLYYNNISWLKDMGALKHLTNLKELDLRLNPVTKNEPDYRLYIVHMLPNLKRLDDRSVRDSERRAAVMHFTTDQASDFTERPVPKLNIESERQVTVPRADMIRNLGPRSALADDDVAVLDLIARTGGDLAHPRGISGSSARAPDVDEFTRDELHNMRNSFGSPTRYKPDTSQTSQTGQTRSPPRQKDRVYVQFAEDTKVDAEGGLKYTDESSAYSSHTTRAHFTPNPNVIGSASSRDIQGQRTHDQGQRTHDQGQITYDQGQRTYDQGQRTHDQAIGFRRDSSREASKSRDPSRSHDYSPKKSQEFGSPGRRTGSSAERNGDVGIPLSAGSYEISPSYESKHTRQRSPVQSQGPAADRIGQRNEDSYSRMPISDKTTMEASQSEVLDKLLDLVDRYWNGSKSLHHNSKFIGMANKLFSSLRGSLTTDQHSTPGANEKLKAELTERTTELSRLREQMSDQQRDLERLRNKMKGQESLQGSLDIASQELMVVKSRLQETQEENSALRTKLRSLEARTLNSNDQERQLEELLRKNNDLEDKVKTFSQQVLQQNQNLEQLQELTTMLQESHRSLVATNDHLLRELDEVRQRHNHEVHQLHWSYDKLKNTMDWIPNGSK